MNALRDQQIEDEKKIKEEATKGNWKIEIWTKRRIN